MSIRDDWVCQLILSLLPKEQTSRSAWESEREPRGDQSEATDRSKATQTLVASEHVVVTWAAEEHRARHKQATDLWAIVIDLEETKYEYSREITVK